MAATGTWFDKPTVDAAGLAGHAEDRWDGRGPLVPFGVWAPAQVRGQTREECRSVGRSCDRQHGNASAREETDWIAGIAGGKRLVGDAAAC